jgi:hypothetical protein
MIPVSKIGLSKFLLINQNNLNSDKYFALNLSNRAFISGFELGLQNKFLKLIK